MAIHKTIAPFAMALILGWNAAVAAQELPVVRMMVVEKARSLILDVPGPFSISNGNREPLWQGDGLASALVIATGGQIHLGPKRISSDKILLEASGSQIRVGNSSFGPALEIISDGKDRITLVSLLDIEEYTQGVMQKEMEPTWPLEVLKAQAVLARTNAVFWAIKNQEKPFHLSRYSPQVYAHSSNVHPNILEAAEQTQGQILLYDDQVIPAYYHSVCGGSTEAAKNVWLYSCPYPAGVECRYCEGAPKFYWKSLMHLSTFQRRLARAGIDVEGMRNVLANKISAVSDRITEIMVEHAHGKTLLRTNTLRNILGHDEIRSTNFTVYKIGGTLVFEGQGWGHGVGLCQWGARAMAKEGKDYREILRFYYPGTRIRGS